MRTIPPSLLEKINKRHQTIYENADPKLKVLLSKGFSKELFRVYTIHELDNIAEIDATAKRSTAESEPDKIYIAYIEDGVAHVKSRPLPYDEFQEWTYEFELGTATNVAIDFDGYWDRDEENKKFNLVADEYPWLFKVNNGSLIAQYWHDNSTELATNVNKIRSIRGWKSVENTVNDQGLIAFYLKNDGNVYYRNLAEQSNGEKVWEEERQITEFMGTIVEIALFRTNDFRVGFIVQNNDGTIEYVITDRNWAAFGINETIEASLQNFSLNFIEITELYVFHEETISANINHFDIGLCPFIEINVASIENPDLSETEIMITFDKNIQGIIPSGFENQFSVVDGNNTSITVTGVAFEGSNGIKLTCENFASANGDLTVTYTKQVNVMGAYSNVCWFDIESFTEIFTPELDPPTGYHSETIDTSLENFSLDFIKIDQYKALHEETIEASLQNFSLDFIHIDDLEV